jgi:hypothetical protein
MWSTGRPGPEGRREPIRVQRSIKSRTGLTPGGDRPQPRAFNPATRSCWDCSPRWGSCTASPSRPASGCARSSKKQSSSATPPPAPPRSRPGPRRTSPITPARRGSTGSSLGAFSSSTRPADHRRRRRPQSGRRRPQAQPPHVVLLRRDRSMLQTGQPKPDAGSQSGTVQANADGSTDVYFGPAPPDERENYWIRPSRAKGSSRSCGSTARRSRSSTRAGGPAKSNRSDHQPQHDETTAGSWPRMTTTISGQQERLVLSLAAAAVLAGCQDRRSLAARAGGRAGRLR